VSPAGGTAYDNLASWSDFFVRLCREFSAQSGTAGEIVDCNGRTRPVDFATGSPAEPTRHKRGSLALGWLQVSATGEGRANATRAASRSH
jgi:hypothetical protein